MGWQPSAFYYYTEKVTHEMDKRKISYKKIYLEEIFDFCMEKGNAKFTYPEHNDRYLKQCYYNLQEKYDRGIISEEEFEKIWQSCNEIVRELM
jgi:hypothetical protein